MEDKKPATLAITLKPSRAWIFHSTSPLQLRSRLSRAYTLIQSSPSSPPPSKRISWPTDLWTGDSARIPAPPSPDSEPSTAATAPPPPYRNLLTPEAASLDQEETEATIFNPKYAQQSLLLLQSSLHQHAQDPTFARQLYIHAVVYLLQGLPPSSSLSDSEKTSLGSALPRCLMLPCSTPRHNNHDDESKPSAPGRKSGQNSAANKTLSSLDDDEDENQTQPTTIPATLLHRALSTTILLIIICIHALTPHLLALSAALRHYDREYNIQARLWGFLAALARRVWDGLVSAVDPHCLIWFAAEVSTGVAEGWKKGWREGMRS
ncbi:MAG: hypothetical protein LQ339_001751 [Xanthoria mediterranea]|nr:MAG: hypothetical protein LQ339_001751 [Xanthoria mediterranea]